MSPVSLTTIKSPGPSQKRPLRRRQLWQALAWVMCSILLIYMFILLNRQEYLSFFETLVFVSILFAMLRTRLSDPTLLVNRTLVYSVFAVCLALIYLGGVTISTLIKMHNEVL